MKEISGIHVDLIKDRGKLKWKVHLIKDNKFFGFIKPVDNFDMRRLD